MRRNQNQANNNPPIDKNDISSNNNGGVIPNSFRFISSYIKTVSFNVRSGSDSSDELRKDQVLYSCFGTLEFCPSIIKIVLLLGYTNGFQVLDVDDSFNFSELVSTRDDPVTFLQIQPTPEETEGLEGFKMSHPLLIVVASEKTILSGPSHNKRGESQMENSMYSPRAVRFYSMRSQSYVHVLRFRSTVYMVRCSPQIVAVGLASQIYCFDALTLENKFSVLTYPISQLGGQGFSGINIGIGSMAVGPRWLAYASNNPLLSNTGCLSTQNLNPSPVVSSSTSPGSGSLMAQNAIVSSKQLASGLINLGDMSYRTLSKYCHELLPDGSSSSVSLNSSRKAGRAVSHSTDNATSGMVVMGPRWKGKGSEVKALANPISRSILDLKSSLIKSNSKGILSGCSVRLACNPEQINLLNQTCFGRPEMTVDKDQWFQFTLEEAFYLYFSLKCIKIVGGDDSIKTDNDLWEYMTSKKVAFPDVFKAYSHLRNKNWVVRSGCQFGVDFVAYRHHPSLVHSEYAVLVFSEGKVDGNDRLRVWSDFQSMLRLCGGVAKTLLILHVNRNGEKLIASSPSCLDGYSVEERTITRWSAERCREDQAVGMK